MNSNAMAADLESVLPSLHVELLSESELSSIDGGVAWMPALVFAAAGGGAAFAGVLVGLAVYYFTR